jgi:Antitoxin VbhA
MSERRAAVAEALGSVRAEGLEPSPDGMAILKDLAAGQLDADDAVALLRRQHGR